MVEEAGVVSDLSKFDINNIDIRASSIAINTKMMENLKNFNCVLKFFAISLDMKKTYIQTTT